MRTTAIKDSLSDRVFTLLNGAFLLLVSVLVLYPLLYIVSASFSSPSAVLAGKVWLWPVEPTLRGYAAVFEYKRVWSGFANSIFYTGVGTLINVAITITGAYALSRKDLRGRSLVMMLCVFTMLFHAGLIPVYLVVKDLGLLDTRWSLILPTALAVWNLIIARTFFQVTIPDALLEASQIDGCTDFKFFFRIVLPLSAPIIAVLCLFYAVGHWNQYFQAMLYLRNPELYPLQMVLRDILVRNEVDASLITDVRVAAERDGLRQLLKYALIVVASVPVLVIYPFVQKHFVKGVMIGSLKG
ncbi:carbohydrate ABC transporter permease [Paenibacillus sp. IB182496]|uniref:Carbohydrate ABC transporter permease n=1 Tax=Paenibacillus sabuli TaxID=2772509 RepID=A0A927BU76_9BACL|nr:carbohydrate ABC transporter permease [Paenibacillus sabuli]MBD2845961.1 carbohydrate ABC transporter permease [Paenibacillus sabuli]